LLDVVRTLVNAAEKQIVLASPRIRSRAMRALVQDLEQALERGVQVFVLWGVAPRRGTIGDDEERPHELDREREARQILVELATRHPGRFFFSWRSSGSRASVVVQDASAALVASGDLLSPQGGVSLGLLVRSCAADDEPPRRVAVVEELLAWAARAYPEWNRTRGMVRFEDVRDDLPSPIDALPARPHLAEAAEADDPLSMAAARAWSSAWREYVSRLRGMRVRPTTRGRVRINAQNSDALHGFVSTASHRLVLVSRRLSRSIVDDTFVSRLDERLHAAPELAVAIVYGHVDGVATRQGLERLASQHPGRFVVIRHDDVRTSVVAVDDTALVSSFDFLGMERRDSASGVARARVWDVGLTLVAPEAADAVVALLAEQIPELGFLSGPLAVSRVAAAEPHLRPGAAVPVQELLEEVSRDHADVSAVLRRTFGAAAEPWTLLEHLVAVDPPAEIARAAVAACIAVTGTAGEDAARWQAWLADDMWGRRKYVEAAILSLATGEAVAAGVLPRPDLALLAAARGRREVTDALEALVALDELSVDEQTAVAAVALCELGLRGADVEPVAREVGRYFADQLSSQWRVLFDALLGYFEATYEPLPMMRIRADLARRESLDARAEAWRKLCDAVNRARDRTFAFGSGKKTHHRFFSDAGIFGKLGRIAHEGDADGLAVWLALNHTELDDLDALLDETTTLATGRNDQLLRRETGTRATYLKSLRSVVDAARAAAGFDEDAGDELRHLTEAEELAARVRTVWPDVVAETVAVAGAERQLLEDVLHDLEPVVAWRS
jgi:hypothetical protein